MTYRLRVVGEGRIDIGIDVGWSKVKRSCALAVRGLEWDDSDVKTYASCGGGVITQVKLFRLDDLVRFLPELIAAIRDRLDHTTVVVDGPLGGDGRPRINRAVDFGCRRGGLNMRVQPNDVTGQSGGRYVEATYRLVDPFLEAAGVSPWLGRGSSAGQLVVAETHPTVAMALMLPMQEIDTLPSRKRPVELPPPRGRTKGRVISAKSDWYWLLGAGRHIADILGSDEVAREEDHERVAGLFCLGMAALLDAGDPDATRALPIGTAGAGQPDGVYIVPRALPDCWEADVERIGLPWERPDFAPYTGTITLPTSTRRSRPVRVGMPASVGSPPDVEPNEEDIDEGPQDGEDRFLLLLDDNGGVWTGSNSWLGGLKPSVRLRALDGGREDITLVPAKNFHISGQWKITPTSKALAVATGRGFSGVHLSGDRCVSLDVELLEEGFDAGLTKPDGSQGAHPGIPCTTAADMPG